MVMHRNASKNGFHIPTVRYEETKSPLVSRAGLQALLHIFDSTDLGDELKKCLPEEGSNRSFGNYQLALLLIASLLSGHDSLDDIEEFDDDELLESLFKGQMPTAKTLGNMLRRFEAEHISELKLFLTKMGYTLREHIKNVHPDKVTTKAHFKIDSTVHPQSGRQMEGAGWIKMSENSSQFGYASQTIFDDLGLCYAGELLPAAHPRGNAAALLDQVLSPLKNQKIEHPFVKVAHVSGDSAYLTEDVIRTLQAHHASFTISAPKTIQWHMNIENADWQPWQYSEEQIEKLRKKRKEPQDCFLTRWHWEPGWAKGLLKFPVVIKKEWRPDEVFGTECGSFHFHAVATNLDLSKQSYQSVIEEYRPRAEMENQIKEFKINFDAQHLPCQKMSANEVYFLFVLIAQNLTRWVAMLEQPDKPHYAKKIRRKLITAPATILTGSRQIILRVKQKFLKEVTAFLERWGSHSVTIPPLAFGTA
jgi:hypothetical protein